MALLSSRWRLKVQRNKDLMVYSKKSMRIPVIIIIIILKANKMIILIHNKTTKLS